MKILHELLGAIDRSDTMQIGLILRDYPELIHFETIGGWPVIHRLIARRCIDLEMVTHFISQGGDVNRKTGSGMSLAFLAASSEEGQPICDLLLANGCEMSAFEKGVLAITSETDEERVNTTIKKLLKKHPETIYERGDGGFTLLHHTVLNNCTLVGLLLEEGADAKAITYTDRSTLGLLGNPLTKEQSSSYAMLVQKGAEYTCFERLIHLLQIGDDEKLLAMFERDRRLVNSWFVPGGPFLHRVVLMTDGVDVMEFMLKHGANPDAINERGETPLHRVMHRTDHSRVTLDLIRSLHKAGADLDKPDCNGNTPLHEAASQGWDEPVKLLVELGAQLNRHSDANETPLDVVASMRFLGGRSLMKWLKDRGAISGKGKRG